MQDTRDNEGNEDPILDALDRLEAYVAPEPRDGHVREALATVREALERLRSVKAIAQIKELLERAESAEAEVRRLREERDTTTPLHALREKNRELRASLEAAEAEVRRLTEGLRDLIKEAPEALDQNAVWVDDLLDLLSASPSDGDSHEGRRNMSENILTREFDAADFTGAEQYALEVIGAHRAALVAFANMMARELAANAHKDSHPLSGDFDHLLSELRGHVEKFAADPTEEHAADVANLAMLALAASPTDAGCDHAWVREHGSGGYWCVLCGAGPSDGGGAK